MTCMPQTRRLICDRCINFVDTNDEQLRYLAETCEHATFGRAHEDVLDESYRKAGKLDKTHFASNFHPVSSGLIDKIRDVLLEGYGFDFDIRVELYKLNVYGTPLYQLTPVFKI